MSNAERELLTQIMRADAMAVVVESGLSPAVFEDPVHRVVFEWMVQYWEEHQKPPNRMVMGNEFPTVKLLAEGEEDEASTGWLCEHLQTRYVANKVDALLMSTAKTLDEDPIATLRELIEQASAIAGQSEQGSKFDGEFLTADQLDDLAAPEPLIADVLTRHSYGILRGRDKSFKSFVALDWSLSLATGAPWQGKAVERTKVLYIAGEGVHGIGARKRAWEAAQDIKVDPEWFVVRRSSVNLFKSGPDVDHLLTYIKRGGFGLVVFDTLRRMSGGAEGNGSDMGVVVDAMDRVKQCTADGSVLTVAHTDKGDHDTRGFSGIEDDADIVWSAKREDNANEVTLTCEKFKDGPDGHRMDLRLRPEGESLVIQDPDPANGNLLALSTDRQADQLVLSTMREVFATEGATVTDLIEMTQLSRASVYRSRARLIDAKRLVANKQHRLFLAVEESHV